MLESIHRRHTETEGRNLLLTAKFYILRSVSPRKTEREQKHWQRHVIYCKDTVSCKFIQVQENNFSSGVLFKIKLQILITKATFLAPIHASETFVNLLKDFLLHMLFHARCRCSISRKGKAALCKSDILCCFDALHRYFSS